MSALELEALGHRFVIELLAYLVRSSALISTAAAVTFLLRHQSAELRHFVCRVMLYGLLLSPVLVSMRSFFTHPSFALTKTPLVLFPRRTTSSKKTGAALQTQQKVRGPRQFPWMPFAAAAYLACSCILILRLLINLARLNRLVSRSEPVVDPDLHQLGHEIWLRSLARYRPMIRASHEVRVPAVVGIDELTILLPAGWRNWNQETLRAVLLHEMAHARRNDPQTAILASLAVCVLWLNPLVYWLRRELGALAEEACDEDALLDVSPENYVRILLDFKEELGQTGRRLAVASTMAVRPSLMERRIRHLFAIRREKEANHLALRLLLVTILFPAVYLISAPQLNPQQVEEVSIGSWQQARQLEAELLDDPENLPIRDALMSFYSNQRNEAAFTPHLLWVIRHHPDAPSSTMTTYLRASRSDVSRDHELVRTAWENALTQHPDSPEVLFHAAQFLYDQDPKRALDLLNRGMALTPSGSEPQARYLYAQAVIYAAAVLADSKSENQHGPNSIVMKRDLALTLRAEIETSPDPALLSATGTILVQFGQDETGIALIEKAVDLEPTNPEWKEALESAKAEAVRCQNRRELVRRSNGTQLRRLR